MDWNDTQKRILTESLINRKCRIREIRDYVLCYDDLVEQGKMDVELQEELLIGWDYEIEKEMNECRKLEKLIKRGFSI